MFVAVAGERGTILSLWQDLVIIYTDTLARHQADPTA
jgi:hypothetical protein